MNEQGDQFGVERLQQMFAAAAPRQARPQQAPPRPEPDAVRAIFEAVNRFAGTAPQFDDVTCLLLRRG